MDTLVSGVHFNPDVDAADLGHKALAVNLSDIAAMGATPRWVTLSLTLPEINNNWLDQFSKGFALLANKHNVALVGGDMSQGPLSVTVQISGVCSKGKALTRFAAQPGDDIYVSGYPGTAAYGLEFLSNSEMNVSPPQYCLTRLLKPEPRVELGLAIHDIAHAAIDLSDGLYADLGHIIQASGVDAKIILADLPVHVEFDSLVDRDDYWEIVLCKGDDYELCFTAPGLVRENIARLAIDLKVPVSRIGHITAAGETSWVLPDESIFTPKMSGYRHFE
jgi:thiamine-monophosphate kinase